MTEKGGFRPPLSEQSGQSRSEGEKGSLIIHGCVLALSKLNQSECRLACPLKGFVNLGTAPTEGREGDALWALTSSSPLKPYKKGTGL